MNKLYYLLLFFFITSITFSQEVQRSILRGKVIYKNTNVPNENVINATTETVTSTNNNGEFEILVAEGDILAFSAVNFKFRTITITREILDKNRLLVEVNEKVTELDEVVITPDDKEKFIDLKEEEFKKFNYEKDASSVIENYALSGSQKGMMYGLNFVNIFKALVKSDKEKEVPVKDRIKISQVLRQVYDDQFFVVDLKIPQEKIDDFLYYCDDKIPTDTLLKKENEFALIDMLVNNSRDYLKSIASDK